MNSIFVTGTDTGVGKTVVTALIALALRELGIDVGVMKPIASGCRVENGEPRSEDAQWLLQTVDTGDELELVNPIRLEEPLAPLVAARRAGIATGDFLPRVESALNALRGRHQCVVVEGVGGLLVPISERNGRIENCIDLAGMVGGPTVVVARRSLGTINHSLLTCAAALKPPARIRGLVFCDAESMAGDDVAAETSPAIIAEVTGLPILAQVPYLPGLQPATIQKTASSMADSLRMLVTGVGVE